MTFRSQTFCPGLSIVFSKHCMGFGKKMHVVTVIQTILRSLLCFDTVKVASSCSVQVCVCLIVLPHVLHS